MKKEADEAKAKDKDAEAKQKKEAEEAKAKRAAADKEIEEALNIARGASAKADKDIRSARADELKDISARSKASADAAKISATSAGVYPSAPSAPSKIDTDTFKPFTYKSIMAGGGSSEKKMVGKSPFSNEIITYSGSDYPVMKPLKSLTQHTETPAVATTLVKDSAPPKAPEAPVAPAVAPVVVDSIPGPTLAVSTPSN